MLILQPLNYPDDPDDFAIFSSTQLYIIRILYMFVGSYIYYAVLFCDMYQSGNILWFILAYSFRSMYLLSMLRFFILYVVITSVIWYECLLFMYRTCSVVYVFCTIFL